MYVGQLVELAPTAAIFDRPRHPYTAALMQAVPVPDPRVPSGDVALRGEVASPADPPSGCYFHPRCPYAADACRRDAPPLREVAPGHFARCHFADELTLRPAIEAEAPAPLAPR
jgi:peptide/nickel transport system ATP-binding protein